MAAYLVRTIRSCPAPGVAPFRTRDWLLIAGVIAIEAVIVLALAAGLSTR